MVSTILTSNAHDGMPVRRDLCLMRGDSFRRNVRISSGGTALSLASGDSACFAVFDGGNPIISKHLSSSDQDENGYLSIAIAPADTENLEPGEYSYELELRFADGSVITPLAGMLHLAGDKITPEIRDSVQ